MDKTELTVKVNKALDRIRPYLQADEGDVRLVEVTDELVVKVELTGACDGCQFSMHTLKAGVEQAIIRDIPQIREVVAING